MTQGSIIKTFTSRKGNTVVFRYPKEEDFSSYWGLACDLAAEDTFIALTKAPTEEEEKKWFADMLQKVAKKEAIYISAYVSGEFAGNSRVLRGEYRHSHVGNLGISLLPKFRGEGIGTELMRSLIDESRTLGLRLLTLSCFENNTKALHIYEKLGFQRVGVTPGAIFYKGDYIGEVHFYLPL